MKNFLFVLIFASLSFATSNCVPITDGGQSLGTTAKRWNTLFVDSVHNYGRTTDTIGWGTALKNDTTGFGNKVTNPLTTIGDIIYATTTATNATPGRLAAGASGTVLQGAGAATLPAYSAWTMAAPGASSTNRLASNGTNWVALASDTIGLGTAFSGKISTGGVANISGGTLGAIPYQSGASATTILAATATANKLLCSGASAAPTWSTPTFPNASATANKIIISDGTNWVASTPTYAAPGSANNMMKSDGTNWTSAGSDSVGLGTKINANQANYRTLAQAQGYMIAGQAVGTYWFGMQDSAASSSGGSSRYSPVIIPWYTADHPTLNGAVATLRVDAICCVNATAPTATFTVGLYPVTKGAGAAGLSIWSLGSVVSGSTVAFTTPSASSITRAVSSAITIPSDGMYVLGVTTTSATIATSSLVNITAYLEERN